MPATLHRTGINTVPGTRTKPESQKAVHPQCKARPRPRIEPLSCGDLEHGHDGSEMRITRQRLDDDPQTQKTAMYPAPLLAKGYESSLFSAIISASLTFVQETSGHLLISVRTIEDTSSGDPVEQWKVPCSTNCSAICGTETSTTGEVHALRSSLVRDRHATPDSWLPLPKHVDQWRQPTCRPQKSANMSLRSTI